MDRAYRRGPFHPVVRCHQSHGIRVSRIACAWHGEAHNSWWEETKHVLRRPGEKDKEFTITAFPLMVRCSLNVTAQSTALDGEIDAGRQRHPLVWVPRQVES